MCAVFQHDRLHSACQWTQCDDGRLAELNSHPVELQLSGRLPPLVLLRGGHTEDKSKAVELWTC